MNTKIKTLTLDYSKWHCGVNHPINGLGEGEVALLNDQGYMCCLGQWCNQLGAPLEMLKGNGEPGELRIVIEPFNYSRGDEDYLSTFNTGLSGNCILVNDDPDTTPLEKIDHLKELLNQEGIDLVVINMPEKSLPSNEKA